jgi:hypothetical protein
VIRAQIDLSVFEWAFAFDCGERRRKRLEGGAIDNDCNGIG